MPQTAPGSSWTLDELDFITCILDDLGTFVLLSFDFLVVFILKLYISKHKSRDYLNKAYYHETDEQI